MNLNKTRFMCLTIMTILSGVIFFAGHGYAFELIAPTVPPTNYVKDNLSVGSAYYLDRIYTIQSQPAGFENYTAILTRNADKYVKGGRHVVFNISRPATVYVAYDSRATKLPKWLRTNVDFTATGEKVYSNGDESMGYFNLYKKDYSAGEVVLGGNRDGAGTDANSNYIVYVKEEIPLAVDPTALNLASGAIETVTISGGVSPYFVTSSAPTVATATLADDTVDITGVGAGSSTITVTDSASTANSATVSVEVFLNLAVNPDTLNILTGGIGIATISGGVSPFTLSSSAPTVATAAMTNDIVLVTGVVAGSSTITVTDSTANSATVAVTVTSIPTVDNTVLNLLVGQTKTVTISGGSSPYTAESNNSTLATASLSNNVVTVTGVAVGSTTITIADSGVGIVTVSVHVGEIPAPGIASCPSPPFVTGANVGPNILLILDHSGSMNKTPQGNNKTRWNTAREVVIAIIDEFPKVRFGLMRMDGSDYDGADNISVETLVRQGGKILRPAGTPGAEIKTIITNWGDVPNTPQTWTNLAETLASAGQYFATKIVGGNRVGMGPAGFGHYELNYHYVLGGTTYDATLTDDKGNPITTFSPTEFYCQKSFIIFITDGLANYDNDWDIVTDFIGDYDDDMDPEDCKNGDAGCAVSGGSSEYFDDVAKYLYDNDMRSDLQGKQNITTYVIGFHIDEPLLESAATKGGGAYYTANNANQLTQSLRGAIKDIMDKISSGSAVATISTSESTEDRLIRSKFLPASWKGFLEVFSLPYAPGDTPVWEAGDVLDNTNIVNRHIYTYMSSETVKKQEFIKSNSIVKDYLSNEWGVSLNEAMDIIDYIRGDDKYEGGKYRDRGSWPLGDIIYSTPVAVGPPKFYYLENDYYTFRQNNLTRKSIIYVGGNDGMLHAFNAADGSEEWAFIPENIQYDCKDLTGECHKYYVDLSPVASDVYDGSQWRTVLIGGNRLGGEEYFSLDVTDPAYDAFSVLWDMVPFSGRKSLTVPVIGKVKWNSGTSGVTEWVALITSGYDEGTRVGEIAAFNVVTGTRENIWYDNGTFNLTGVTTQAQSGITPYYTMTSPVSADTDDDGYLDLIYAGDTEGSLWKFYYDQVDKIWKKVEIFQTGGQPITAKPILAFDKEGRLRIFFGTGKYLIDFDRYNMTRNAFYSLVEEPVSTTDANDGYFTGTTIFNKANDLTDVTSIVTQQNFDYLATNAQQDIINKGWYFQLDDPAGNPGERVVSEAAVIAGVVFFTSLVPNYDVCGYGGDARLYAINYKTSLEESVYKDEPLEGKRYRSLGAGLPSKPVYYFDTRTKESKIFIQTSDTTLHSKSVDLSKRPFSIESWRDN